MTASTQDKKTLLILSFSDISSDARVLKQIARFRTDYVVDTCGYGPKPPGVRKHLRIPDDQVSLALDGRLITARQYRAAFWSLPAVRAMKRLTRPYRDRTDIVLANEPETVPIALRLKPKCGVHADLHEYSPSLHEQIPEWNRRIKPYNEWLIRKYTSRADSWSSVGRGVSARYEENFDFSPLTVTNASPYKELIPSPVAEPLRLVHHGGAQRNRALETLIEGVEMSEAPVSLDLFLTGVDPEYREALRELASDSEKVSVHDGIPYEELLETLNRFDVGLHILPPVNFNNEYALPNKLFDFVQARLGQVVSPNPEMKEVVDTYGLGLVTGGFSAEDLARSLNSLTPEKVAAWKENANRQALALSSQPQVEVWAGSLNALSAACGEN